MVSKHVKQQLAKMRRKTLRTNNSAENKTTEYVIPFSLTGLGDLC